MSNDFNRKFPNEKKSFKAISMPTRENKPEQQPLDDASKRVEGTSFGKVLFDWYKKHATVANIIMIFSFALAMYQWGVSDGKEKAEDKYPKELAAVKTSLSSEKEKNAEIMADKKTLQEENDRLKTKIIELEESLEQTEKISGTVEESTGIIRKPIDSSESYTIGEGKSGRFFDSKVFISVQNITVDPNGVKTVNIKANTIGYPIQTYEKLGVGEKVTYSTETDKYEIFVSEIGYDVDILITKIEPKVYGSKSNSESSFR